MSIHDVPRRSWAKVLEEFSRGHRGWLASVAIVGSGPVLSSHTEVRPLESVTVTPADSVRVAFRGGPTVLVDAPRTLAVDKRDDGAECALEIDTAVAEFVRLTFRSTAVPEALDGIAPAELGEPVG
jgi:hypothetical protein